MKYLVPLLVILLLTLAARSQGQAVSPSQAERRVALVIGNGAYANAPLKNPPNDATDMADALAKLNFDVAHGVDLKQRQMKAMIREFGEKLKAGGQGLFYFAGHGVQLRGRNYMIPVDADIRSEADVEDQGVDANLVLALMDEAGNALNVVILDACRNNPFTRSFRSISSGLAQLDAPSGTLIAYATAPGSVASDGNSRNGLYTQELLKSMLIPGLSIEEVFKRVRISVRSATTGRQTPWESSSLTGDFYFIGSTKAVNSIHVEPAADSVIASSPPPAPAPNSAPCFADDPEAGSRDRAFFYKWASGRDAAMLVADINGRVALLFDCAGMNTARLSNAFANVAVIIARYVPDSHCFDGDAGVFGADFSNQRSWAFGKGAGGMRDDLQWKISAAFKCLNRMQRISFFADASVAVAGAPYQ